MLRLYKSGSSQEIQLVQQSMHPEIWARVRGSTCRLLQTRGSQQAAELLSSLPFEMWEGTNGFNDEFRVLYAELPVNRYVEVADLEADPAKRRVFSLIARALEENDTPVRFIAVSPDQNPEPAAVAAPSLQHQSEVLEGALLDVERHLTEGRPASGIDRIHTAFHAYLLDLARSTGMDVSNASMPEILKTLRRHHPALQPKGARAGEITRVLNAMATIVDALNPLRNTASLAHPNEQLLPEAEAMLVINVVRSLLHYLEKRIGTKQN